MPRIYKRKARKDLYFIGLKTSANNKQGFVFDRSKPADQFDRVAICKGEEYYAWHPKGRPWQYSKEKPVFQKRKSEWEEKCEEFEARKSECYDVEGLEDDWNDLVSEIEEYRDELQSRLDNMPYQLQESSVLNERIEQLEDMLEL